MKLKCLNKECEYVWEYKGSSKFYATCPRCYNKVKLDKSLEKAEKEEVF